MSSKGYYVYLDKCLLPVAPSRITCKYGSLNQSVQVTDGGEVSILNDPKLTEVQLDFIIPQRDYPFKINSYVNKSACYYIEYLQRLKELKKPFQFIVSRSLPDGRYLYSSNIKVSLEDYTLKEDADRGMDIGAHVRLKEYRDHSIKRVKLSSLGIGHSKDDRPPSTVTQKPIVIGSEVIVNGRLYGTSYGDAPGQMRTNYRGRVNFINLNGSHPYHITTPAGLWQGWVTKSSIKAVT